MFWSRDLKIKKWLPQLQSHRGYWVEGLMQNSLGSIRRAYEQNYQMVEFDVRLTRDNVVVLFHDESFENRKIELLYRVELPHLNTLEEVFYWFTKQREKIDAGFHFKLNIEIKSKKLFNGDLEKEVFRLIEKYQMNRFVLISSFNPFSLFRFKRYDSSIYRAFLLSTESETGALTQFLLKKFTFNILSRPHLLHLRWEDFKLAQFRRVASQVPVILWTVNNLKEIESFGQEISGVISDRITPEELKN
jgi:glycerophosphoryl diester phosphodiesterase